ncbi:type VI secretion system contractile sheath small subunit [candidate division CSSED10-310 bacterium]|uniref:Type VI secretion system contractile sheath small subunit n=1 Tax=candidate division CSSED10-310 bacterium TaxID=2855610 RepID=A0ABV6Z1W3_UNCC1
MAKEASVAPKERVNIVYKPATGDAKEEVELPLKVLVMGDFTNRADDTPVEDRKALNIDKDNFDSVLSSQNLKLDASVDKLSEEPDAKMSVSLDFKSMKDFDPDSIIEKVPELKQLIDLRNALKALKGPLGNVPDFRKKIQELVQDEGARERLLKELGLE